MLSLYHLKLPHVVQGTYMVSQVSSSVENKLHAAYQSPPGVGRGGVTHKISVMLSHTRIFNESSMNYTVARWSTCKFVF